MARWLAWLFAPCVAFLWPRGCCCGWEAEACGLGAAQLAEHMPLPLRARFFQPAFSPARSAGHTSTCCACLPASSCPSPQVIKQVAKMLQTSAKGAQPRGEEAQRVLSVFAASLKNPTLVSAPFKVGRVAGGAAGLLSASFNVGRVAGCAAGLLSSSLKAGLVAGGATGGLLSTSLLRCRDRQPKGLAPELAAVHCCLTPESLC